VPQARRLAAPGSPSRCQGAHRLLHDAAEVGLGGQDEADLVVREGLAVALLPRSMTAQAPEVKPSGVAVIR
jgi:hypothetical protein